MPPTHQNTFTTSTSQLLTNAIDLTQSGLTSSSDSYQHQERIKRPTPDSAEAGPWQVSRVSQPPFPFRPQFTWVLKLSVMVGQSHSSLPLYPTAERETEARSNAGSSCSSHRHGQPRAWAAPPPTAPNSQTVWDPAVLCSHLKPHPQAAPSSWALRARCGPTSCPPPEVSEAWNPET